MNILDSYTHSLLLEINKAGVEYIVVGGYAVNFHGYRRTTGDIDLWIKPDNINKRKIISALRCLSIDKDTLLQLDKYDFTKHFVFSDGEEPYKIDFITFISGVTFDEAWKQKIVAEIDGIQIPFIHLNHLILSKITTGRPQDKIDVEILQKVSQLKKKN